MTQQLTDLIRCPLCRDVVQADHDALGQHIRAHSWWDQHRIYWTVSRPMAIALIAYDVLIVGIPAFFIGRLL